MSYKYNIIIISCSIDSKNIYTRECQGKCAQHGEMYTVQVE